MSLIKSLSNRLSVLGYSGYEISQIINSATGGQDISALTGQDLHHVANTMEHYVQAGSQFVAEYSK